MKEITIGEWVKLFMDGGGTLHDIMYELDWVSTAHHERPTREFLVVESAYGVEIFTREMVNTLQYVIRYRIADPQSAKTEADMIRRLDKL